MIKLGTMTKIFDLFRYYVFTGYILQVLSYNWLPTLENGSEIIRCIGENVEFPWKLQWDPSVELLTGFSWTQHLDTKIILLATFKLQDRTFWIQSNTSFEDRLFHTGMASIRLTGLRKEDSTLFGVHGEMNLGNTVPQFAHLLIAEIPKLEAENLELTFRLKSINETQKPQLTCGRFTNLGVPNVSVKWEDSAGRVFESTGFENGYFVLDLPKEYKDMAYYCFLSQTSPGFKCLENNSSLRERSYFALQVQVQMSESVTELQTAFVWIVVGCIFFTILIVILLICFVQTLRKGRGNNQRSFFSQSGHAEESFSSNKIHKFVRYICKAKKEDLGQSSKPRSTLVKTTTIYTANVSHSAFIPIKDKHDEDVSSSEDI